MADPEVKYDPAVIREFAARLYKRAREIVLVSAVGGVLSGAIVGSIAGGAADGARAPTAAVLALIGLFVGLFVGKHRAFALKLQAQISLCQVQIEANTRPR